MNSSDFVIPPAEGPEEAEPAGKRVSGEKQADSSEEKDLSIEEMFDQLDEIVRKLEDGSSTLEASFEYYEAGMRLVRACGRKIDKVEKQILVLNGQEAEE